MTTPHDEPAFPVSKDVTGGSGLTKLEYFSAMAMQGIVSNSKTCLDPRHNIPNGEVVAKAAVQYAQSLLDELEKRKGK